MLIDGAMFVCLVDDIELPFDWLIDGAMFVCLVDDLILDFRNSNLTR